MHRAAIVCLAFLIGSPGAFARSTSPDASELRSAFLLRASGADRVAEAGGGRQRQARLRRHFELVLSVLIERSPASLTTAVDRLEQSRDEQWDANQRAAWRKKLATARLTQLERLQRYARRGLFPFNEHVAGRAVPVFVDNYDTACAVGHLMRESGWKEVVALIQSTNNLVYVTDRDAGPVAQWALTSGLTREEAALIQPAYEPPPFNSNLAQLTIAGSVMTDDLEYKNFRIGRGASQFDARISYSTGGPNDPNYLAQLGVAVGDYLYVSPSGPSMNTLHDEWAFIGGGTVGGMASLQQPSTEQWIMLSYDVTTRKAGRVIAAAALESIAIFNFNYLFQGPPAAISVTSYAMPLGVDGILASNLALATLSLSSNQGPQSGPFLHGIDNAELSPRTGLTISTVIKLTGPGEFTSFINSFAVVPEPASLTMASIIGLAALRPRKRSTAMAQS